MADREIYFISNRTDRPVEDVCLFRDGTLNAELWDAVTGEIRPLTNLKKTSGGILIPIKLDASQSYFVLFNKSNSSIKLLGIKDFPVVKTVSILNGSWNVTFDPKWGGPAKVVFDSLADWTTRPEVGIRYYSGIATYSKTFDLPDSCKSLKSFLVYLF